MRSNLPRRPYLGWYPISGDEGVAELFVLRATDQGVDRSIRVVQQKFHRPRCPARLRHVRFPLSRTK